MRWCWPPAATRASISCPRTQRPPTPPRSGGRTAAGRRSPIPASCSFIPPAFPRRASTRRSSPSCPGPSGTTGGWGVPLRAGHDRRPEAIPETERDYFLERRYPRFGNLVPRDLGTRACKALCDDGRGVGPGGRAVYLDLTEAAERLGGDVLRERYGNLFEIYTRITGDDPLHGAMRIAP